LSFTARTRYLLVSLAVLTAGAIQFWRGVRPIIVVSGVIAFLFFGNLVVFLAGSKERAIRRQRRRDYYAN
jgi:hypothetical protein